MTSIITTTINSIINTFIIITTTTYQYFCKYLPALSSRTTLLESAFRSQSNIKNPTNTNDASTVFLLNYIIINIYIY